MKKRNILFIILLAVVIVLAGCSLVEPQVGSGDLSFSLPGNLTSRAVGDPEYTEARILLTRGGSYLSLNNETLYQNTSRVSARQTYPKGSEVSLKGLTVGNYHLIVSLANAAGDVVGFDRVPFTIRAGEVTKATAQLYRQQVALSSVGKTTSFNSGLSIAGKVYLVTPDGELWIDGTKAASQPTFSDSRAKLAGIVRGYIREGDSWVSEPWLLVNYFGIVPIRSGGYVYSFSETLTTKEDVKDIASAEVLLLDTKKMNDPQAADPEEFKDEMVVAVLQGPSTLALAHLMEGDLVPESWLGLGEVLGSTTGLEDILGSTALIKSGIVGDNFLAVSTPLNDFYFTYDDIRDNMDTFEKMGDDSEGGIDVGTILTDFAGYGFFNGTTLAGRQVGSMIATGSGSSERIYVFVQASNSASSGIYSRLISEKVWTLIEGTAGLKQVKFSKSPSGKVIALNRDADLINSLILLQGAKVGKTVPFYAGLPDTVSGQFWDGETLALLGGKGVRRINF